MLGTKLADRAAIAAISLAVAVCLVLSVFSGSVFADADKGIEMEYESELFGHDSIMTVDIIISEDDWQNMLDNASDEEYTQCDVKINGTTYYSVGIRPKGNTSLSSIATDPSTDRYSFKIEFDHYIDGQTCCGLDKLVLNNNYADATNMKEAIVYDMFAYLGADSSLYNYARISVNGEYWGIYLALEGVEDSFMLRNYGTENGSLYKPDSMEMGGGSGKSDKNDKGGKGDFSMPDDIDFSDFDSSDFEDMFSDIQNSSQNSSSATESSSDNSAASSSDSMKRPGENSGFDMRSLENIDCDALAEVLTNAGYSEIASAISDMDFEALSTALQNADKDAVITLLNENGYSELAEMLSSVDFSDLDSAFDMGGGFGGGGGGGFGSGSGGSDLNYTDDDLDSYSDIWDGALSDVKKSDKKRVVAALKAASEGTDLEEYLDIDNLLKYMAVHEFVVNLDSLSGNMAHNYYLYESDGTVNIIPWDYNLAFGGMNGTSSDTVNSAIDTPFSGTQFFDKILENEEYLAKYHEYLRILCDEYVDGGVLTETYNRIRSQIDELVNTDPNAFYTYDAYDTAAQTLLTTIELRAQSVTGQLDGTIPSTDDGQRQDSSALIDTSSLDISVMGGMGGGNGGGGGGMGGGFGRGGFGGGNSDFTAPSDDSDNAGTSTDTAASESTASAATADATEVAEVTTTALSSAANSNDSTTSTDGGEFPQGLGGRTPPDGASGDFGSKPDGDMAGGGMAGEKPSDMPSDFPDNAGDSSGDNTDTESSADSASKTESSAPDDGDTAASTAESASTAQTAEAEQDTQSSNSEQQPQSPDNDSSNNDSQKPSGGGRGDFSGGSGGDFPDMQGGSGSSDSSAALPEGLIPILISAGVIAAGLVFATLFKRRR